MASKTRALLNAVKYNSSILVNPINQFNYTAKAQSIEGGREVSEKMDRELFRLMHQYIGEDLAPYEKPKKEKGILYLSPSQFGGMCSLQGVFKVFGIQETIPNHDPAHVGRMERIFKNGDAVHYRLSAYFGLMGILESREDSFRYKLTDKIHFSGRLDNIVNVYDTMRWDFSNDKFKLIKSGESQKYVVDLKSAKDRSFKEMVNAGSPTPGYRMQLEIYMRVTGLPGVLLMENKDTQELAEFLLKPSNDVWKMIKQEANHVLATWESGVLPERDEGLNPDRFPCTFCGYRNFCWNETITHKQETISQRHNERLTSATNKTRPKKRKLSLR